MASAKSLDELLDFETAWDSALETVLGTLPFSVNTRHENDSLANPFISASFTFGGDAPIQGGPQPAQRGTTAATYDPVSFKGRIEVQIVADRKWVNASAVNAGKLQSARGGVRRLFLPSEAKFNATTLPWYDIASIEQVAGERSVDVDRDLDITDIAYEIVWFIRPSAWPV